MSMLLHIDLMPLSDIDFVHCKGFAGWVEVSHGPPVGDEIDILRWGWNPGVGTREKCHGGDTHAISILKK
jgi:hypothetical protein